MFEFRTAFTALVLLVDEKGTWINVSNSRVSMLEPVV